MRNYVIIKIVVQQSTKLQYSLCKTIDKYLLIISLFVGYQYSCSRIPIYNLVSNIIIGLATSSCATR